MFSVRPQFFSSVKKFLRLLQNRVQATHLFLQDDDLGWGAPGLGDDLGWGGEATGDAQGCGGGPPPLVGGQSGWTDISAYSKKWRGFICGVKPYQIDFDTERGCVLGCVGWHLHSRSGDNFQNWDSMLFQCRNKSLPFRNAQKVSQNTKCTRWGV